MTASAILLPSSMANRFRVIRDAIRSEHFQSEVMVVRQNEIRETYCPPESGGQHDRDVVEIVRGVVPKPHLYPRSLRNHPSRDTLRDPAALLTQEGNMSL